MGRSNISKMNNASDLHFGILQRMKSDYYNVQIVRFISRFSLPLDIVFVEVVPKNR